MPSPTTTAPTTRRRWHAADVAPFISLVGLVLFFSFAADGFLRLGTITLILQQASVLAIVAAGLTFVLLCAEIDLSVGYLALLAACICGVLYERPFAAGPGGTQAVSTGITSLLILAPLAAVVLLGWLSGVLTVWSRLPSFIITLAMMNIADGAARYLTEANPFDVPPLLEVIGNGKFTLLKIDRDVLFLPYSTLLAALVLLVGHLTLQHTRFGRYVYMTGGNREAARLAGVRTAGIVIACLTICAATAALGGLVNAGRLEKVTLDQNKDLLLDAVACVVLGGTSLFGGEGGIGKTIIGVATFTVLKVGLNLTDVDDQLRPCVLGIVLMAALVLNGHLSKLRRT